MATIVGTIYLNGCNYQLQYDLLNQSIPNNSSTVRLYGILNVTNNYIAWSSGSASVHTASTGIGTYYAKGSHTLITADFTFNHNSDGTLTLSIGYGLNTTFVSGSSVASITLPKINRVAITNNVTGNDIDGEFSIDYTKYVTSYLYKLRISIPYVEMLQTTDYNTSGEIITLNNQTLSRLYSYMTTNEIDLGFAIETWDGNTKLSDGNEKIIKCKLTNANPIFSNFEFEDTNTVTKALTGSTSSNVVNVNGYSNIKATLSTTNKATPQKGATLSKYRFKINNDSIDINYSSTDTVSGTINNATSGVYEMYAIDSRNNSTLVTKQATRIINYENIYLNKQNCSVERSDSGVGNSAILRINGTFWNGDFGSTTNSITSVTYKLKKTDSSTWVNGTTLITPTISNNNLTFSGYIASNNNDTSWDLDSSYNIQITINDKLSSTTIDLLLNSAIPTVSFDKKGVGIMCKYVQSLGGLLQVGGKRYDISTVYSTEEQVIGTWVDDKPLYRKTLFESRTSKTQYISISDLNVDNIFIDFTHSYTTDETNNRITPFLVTNVDVSSSTNANSGKQANIYVNKSKTIIFIESGSLVDWGDIVLTIEYTKSTD